MKIESSWTTKITPIFLALSIMPLIVVGAALVILSYTDLRSSSEQKQTAMLSEARIMAESKVEAWKQILQASGLSLRRGPSRIKLQLQYLRRLRKNHPEFVVLKKFNAKGRLLAQVLKPGTLKTYRPPMKNADFRARVRAEGIWRGPVQFPEEGPPRLPLVLFLPPSDKNRSGYFLAEVDLSPLSDLLTIFPQAIGIMEEGSYIAHSNPGRVLFAKEKPTEPQLAYTMGMSDLGWQLKLNESRWATLKPVVVLFLQFFLAIVIVGFVTALLGIIVTKRAQKAIAHQERLSTIGYMASTIVHEIRTGLAVIRNSLGFLRKDKTSVESKAARHMDIIESQIRQSNKILSDVLSISKKKSLSLEPASINKLIEETLEELPRPAGIHYEKDLPAGLPDVLLDVGEFKQALSNVLINAMQAMEKGGSISIRTRNYGSRVSVSIQDAGVGVDADLQKKIFDPFVTTKSQGTGLGLPVVKKVIEGHGGTMMFRSKPGKGTLVQLVFPRSKEQRKPEVDTLKIK